MFTYPYYNPTTITLQHDSNYSTTHIISMGSKLFLSLKYTFHSIYSKTSPYTKHNSPNNLFKHALGWVYVNIPILLTHNHFPLCKKLCCKTLQTTPPHILFQWDQNYFPHSNILSTQYIPTTVHTLNTTYKIIYLNTLCIWFMFTYPFYSSTAISPCSKNYITTQFKLFHYTYYFNGSKLFPSLKYTFHSIHSNTSAYTKHNLQSNLFKHTLGWVYVNIPISLPHGHFQLCKKLCHNTIQTIPLHILFQWDQNYFPHSNILSTQYIPITVHTLNTTYKIIYLNTLCVGFMFTYPFYSPMVTSPCSKNYITTQFKLFHYTLFQWDQNYFPHSNIFSTQYIPTTVHTLNTTYQIFYLNTLCVGFMFTYPFYSPMATSPCSKNYITTQFKLFHYTYYFNWIKIISLIQIYFPLNIFQQQSIH